MALSSSLFTGTSGLKNMGNALQVTGNNISNINTIGFKKGRASFADTLYETTATRAGADQMGRGMSLGDVSQNFTKGSFESTGNSTDMSIGGEGGGFFVVRQERSENMFYTKAGNFFFNKSGQLVNPEGFVVQGWDLDEETGDDVGAIKDLVLKSFSNPPKKTSRVTAVSNLYAKAESQSRVLSNRWDAGKDKPLPATARTHQTVVKAYDSLGSGHDVSIFYDKKSETEWEYIVTCNPQEDNRNLVQGTDSKGLLARGVITFSRSSGDILDISMDKFTGRLGNFKANGVNTVKDVNYEILNGEPMMLDGYGFEFTFDGSEWHFTDKNNDGIISPATELPANYPKADIIYSDKQEIHLVLDQTSPPKIEPDLKIKLRQPAVATDFIGFDINNVNDLHVQNIENLKYEGEANENTGNNDYEINAPGVMTHDSKGVGIAWDPSGGSNKKGQWYWSNPVAANSAGTLISNISLDTDGGGPTAPVPLDATAGTATEPVAKVLNPEKMPRRTSDLNVRYDGTNWDWNDKLKSADFTNTYNFNPKNEPAMKITTQGVDGTLSTTAGPLPSLHWVGDRWSMNTAGTATTSGALAGNLHIVIDTAESSSTGVTIKMWNGNNGGTSTAGYSVVKYSFGSSLPTSGSQYIEFSLDPTPPKEYSKAVIKNTTAGTASFSIDFDSDKELDLELNPTAGGNTIGGGAFFTFNIDPNVPPPEYKNATIKGDQESAVIDLDGSGNDNDRDDIRFVFKDPLKFGPNTHPYDHRSQIRFDILGSTAWTSVQKSEIEDTGYFSFTADFLGGEFGSTQNDIELDLGSMFQENSFVNSSSTTTQWSNQSFTRFGDADGYAAGDFLGVEVSSDGTITGRYSNGQLVPLFRVGLAKFKNNFGLSNAGGNLFKETRASGAAITNRPGENGLGKIAPNSLEMSNVDISEEFVTMITNQRGFQANSKTVTTIDQMYETVIQMKR